jgi:NTP pyrophosphatase (non-canonical NTP hydrolase)
MADKNLTPASPLNATAPTLSAAVSPNVGPTSNTTAPTPSAAGEPGPTAPTLSIRQAQDLVDGWIRTTGVRYFSELTNMAILTEEVGEVARLMSRLYGDQSFKDSDKGKELSDELADVLWIVLCIANQTGIDLTTALEKNFTKKAVRDATRHQENEKLK